MEMVKKGFELIDPSELKAIMDHKWYLSQKARREVSIEEAMEDFRERYRSNWLQSRLTEESREQIEEIFKYKWFRSEEEGHDIGETQAALEWIQRFAGLWRHSKETLEANGFLEMDFVVNKEEGHSIQPASRLSDIARRFDCDVYFHTDKLGDYNFILNGRAHVSVKSVICPHALTLCKDDRIEFIAVGEQAREALETLRQFFMPYLEVTCPN
jgi:phosphotransferase system HPr-like phosphotransfer protein